MPFPAAGVTGRTSSNERAPGRAPATSGRKNNCTCVCFEPEQRREGERQCVTQRHCLRHSACSFVPAGGPAAAAAAGRRGAGGRRAVSCCPPKKILRSEVPRRREARRSLSRRQPAAAAARARKQKKRRKKLAFFVVVVWLVVCLTSASAPRQEASRTPSTHACCCYFAYHYVWLMGGCGRHERGPASFRRGAPDASTHFGSRGHRWVNIIAAVQSSSRKTLL
jgi:hypothetical protein